MMVTMLSCFFLIAILPKDDGRAAEKEVIGIEAAIEKTNWEIGSVISKDDIIVKLIYEDGTTERLVSQEFSIISETTILEGENKITVRYIDGVKSCVSSVIVQGVEKEVETIQVSLKTDRGYGLGKIISLDDIIVTAQYNTGDEKEVSAECKILNSEIKQLGKNIVTITYQYGTRTVESNLQIEGMEVALEKISVEYQGEKNIPANGEIDSSKIIVTGYYNNDKSQMLTGFYVLPYNIEQGKLTVITVKYDNLEASFVVCGIAAIETMPPTETVSPTETVPPMDTMLPIETVPPSETMPPTIIPTYIVPTHMVPTPPEDTSAPKETETPKETESLPTFFTPVVPTSTVQPSLPKLVDYTMESTLKGLVFSSDKTLYNIYTNKNFICNFNTRNIKKIQYQFVKQGESLKNKWKTVSNNKLEFKKTGKYVIYIKFIAFNGSETIEKTQGFVLDKSKPSIKGVANNKTYKKKVTIKCSDSLSGIKTIMLNGKKIVKNYTVSKNGKYSLVAKDKANNQKKVTFRISIPKPAAPKPKPSTPKPSTPKPATPRPATPKPTKPKTVPVKSIRLSSSFIKMSVGTSKTIGIVVSPSNATNKTVIWRSTDSNVVSVSSNGRVTARKKGTAYIYVVSKSNSSVTARCSVRVE